MHAYLIFMNIKHLDIKLQFNVKVGKLTLSRCGVKINHVKHLKFFKKRFPASNADIRLNLTVNYNQIFSSLSYETDSHIFHYNNAHNPNNK